MTKRESEKAACSSTPSKKDRFLALLQRDEGAAIAEIVEATGWQSHSARAMLTGLRKGGTEVTKLKVEGVTRYQIPAACAS
jgi:hypothetical protein